MQRKLSPTNYRLTDEQVPYLDDDISYRAISFTKILGKDNDTPFEFSRNRTSSF